MVHTSKPMVVVLIGPGNPVAWSRRVDIPDLGPIRSHSHMSALNTAGRKDHRALCRQKEESKSSPAAELDHRCVRMSSGQKYKEHFPYINQWGLKRDPWAPCGPKNHCPSLPQGLASSSIYIVTTLGKRRENRGNLKDESFIQKKKRKKKDCKLLNWTKLTELVSFLISNFFILIHCLKFAYFTWDHILEMFQCQYTLIYLILFNY